MLREAGKLLRSAATTLHRDPGWLQTILIGGLLSLTLAGMPWVAGLVMESLDNSRKGYPTPLPPWYNWGTRYLIGLFALLIDFTFFILPLMAMLFFLFCFGAGVLLSGENEQRTFQFIALLTGSIGGTVILLLFLSSVAPAARILYAMEGTIENALGMLPLRWTLNRAARGHFWRARLASLGGYGPAATIALLIAATARISFVGQTAVLIVLVWLLLSSILYAHLIVIQVYVAVEKEIPRTILLNLSRR